jgi:hypothetical protein
MSSKRKTGRGGGIGTGEETRKKQKDEAGEDEAQLTGGPSASVSAGASVSAVVSQQLSSKANGLLPLLSCRSRSTGSLLADEGRDFGFSSLTNGTSASLAKWMEATHTRQRAKRAREAEVVARDEELSLAQRFALSKVRQLQQDELRDGVEHEPVVKLQEPLPLPQPSAPLQETKPFAVSPFVLDSMSDLLVSLQINLFPSCFTIDASTIAYPYEEPYRQFVRAIDTHRLSPDVLDVLSEKVERTASAFSLSVVCLFCAFSLEISLFLGVLSSLRGGFSLFRWPAKLLV